MTLSSRSSLIGVSISLAGNILISLALNCQKLAHLRLQHEAREDKIANSQASSSAGVAFEDGSNEHTALSSSRRNRIQDYSSNASSDRTTRERTGTANEESEAEIDKTSTDYLHSRLWWLGLALMSLGELGNFLSYGFAPASLVAPLGAVALLANVIFAPILLHESFQLSDLGGISLAIVGAVTVVISSKQSDTLLDPQQLLQAVSRTEFIIYCVTASVLALMLTWTSFTHYGDRFVLVDVGVCALFGGFTVLSTKGLSSLLTTGRPLELLKYPITYGLLIVLIGTALAQVTFLNRALQRFDSREVIPAQFVSFTISAIVGSAVLYQDFAEMSASRLLNFFFGCLTTFAGVLLLTNNGEGKENRVHDETPVEHDSSSVFDRQDERRDLESAEYDGRRSGPLNVVARPFAMPRAHPVASNSTKGKNRSTASALVVAVPAGSLPLIGANRHALVDPQALASSLVDVESFQRLSARRSIFNPAFTIAYMEAPEAKKSPRRGRHV